MDPKIYLLLLLFGMIVAGASHTDLREFLRKLNVVRPGRRDGGFS